MHCMLPYSPGRVSTKPSHLFALCSHHFFSSDVVLLAVCENLYDPTAEPLMVVAYVLCGSPRRVTKEWQNGSFVVSDDVFQR